MRKSGRPPLRDPIAPAAADVLVMETTYGDRLHKPLRSSIEKLYQAIEDTFRRGGNVIVPTFALERAQEMLYHFHVGVETGRLLRSMQVFLDSPMAISAIEIFRRHPECYDAETAALFREGEDPLALPGLHFTRESTESIALNRITGLPSMAFPHTLISRNTTGPTEGVNHRMTDPSKGAGAFVTHCYGVFPFLHRPFADDA